MRSSVLFVLMSLVVACGGNPCDEYVDLLCDCEDADECDADKLVYENADADLQDECSANLDQAEEDAQACSEDETEG
jgi:hypothetical protein